MKELITQRTAQDSCHAQLIAQVMENAGADVFSICCDGHGYFQVFCKHAPSLTEDTIDREIGKEIERKAACYS